MLERDGIKYNVPVHKEPGTFTTPFIPEHLIDQMFPPFNEINAMMLETMFSVFAAALKRKRRLENIRNRYAPGTLLHERITSVLDRFGPKIDMLEIKLLGLLERRRERRLLKPETPVAAD